MVFRRTVTIIVLVSIFSIVIAGCIDENITTSIDKWNKVTDKRQELKLLDTQYSKIIESDNAIMESELAKETPNLDIIPPFLDKWKKMFDEEKKLLEEESSLISDFAGSTAILDGDAKKYAESALTNIRESNRYAKSSLDNGYRMIENLEICIKNKDNTYCNKVDQYTKAIESDSSKSDLYADNANDDIKRLEALQ